MIIFGKHFKNLIPYCHNNCTTETSLDVDKAKTADSKNGSTNKILSSFIAFTYTIQP